MTTLVEEMAEAIFDATRKCDAGGDPLTDSAQAALDCVLKRLRYPTEEMELVVENASTYLMRSGDAADITRALATHLDQERRGK
jgi:hypothetical protein